MVARDAPTAPIRRTICPIIGVRSITDAHTGLAALKTASFALLRLTICRFAGKVVEIQGRKRVLVGVHKGDGI